MLWFSSITCVAALASGSLAAPAPAPASELVARADSSVYRDSETGFVFSQYSAQYAIGKYLTFRIAVPSPAPSNFDAVIQVLAPKDIGWTGLAWGGTMPNNPLTVTWANGNGGTVSSRYSTGHTAPTAYTGASYTLLKKGTGSNSTHWRVAAKCTGCTSFNGRTLNPTGSNRLAFAYSSSKPSSPSSNTSSFPVHDVTAYWDHDFSSAGNTNFASLVTSDSGIANATGRWA